MEQRTMIPSLASRRREIGALCRRFHVRRLDVFGSAARGDDFDPERSDIDFIVEYDPTRPPPDFGDFFDLQEALSKLLGRKVDLMTAQHIRNPYLKASIERSREPVYGA
jgi:uncharacterized protein